MVTIVVIIAMVIIIAPHLLWVKIVFNVLVVLGAGGCGWLRIWVEGLWGGIGAGSPPPLQISQTINATSRAQLAIVPCCSCF